MLGMASDKERLEFERLTKKYPELIMIRNDFELSLEHEALVNAVAPPAYVKEEIFARIRQEKTSNTAGKVVSIFPTKTKQKSFLKNWSVAASIIFVLMLGCGYMVYTFYSANEQLKNDIAKTKNKVEELEAKKRVIEENSLPPDYQIKQARVVAPQQAIPPAFNVYWDSTNTSVYIVIKNLSKLPDTKKYELWSVTKGKYQSLGIFDSPVDDKLIIKMDNVKNADSFAITIVDVKK